VALDTAEVAPSEESLRSAVVGFGGWVTPGVRPMAALRVERWSGDRQYLAASLGAEFRASGNRFALSVTGDHAISLSAAKPSYTRGAARAMWASSLGLGRPAWSARLGLNWVSADTPLGAWPVVGGNLSWEIPLRAEPLAEDGILAGRSTGRTILHGGLAGDYPIYRLGPLVFAAGIFLDGAEVSSAADGSGRSRFALDGGGGIRIGIGDGHLGVVRIDLATGLLEDRRSALTVGVHRSWPLFRQESR
jgi:hypothetical protein